MSAELSPIDRNSWKLLSHRNIQLQRCFKNRDMNVYTVYDAPKFKTHLYDPRILVVRRGTSFDIFCEELGREKIEFEDLKISLEAVAAGNYIRIKLNPRTPKEGFSFLVKRETDGRIIITVNVNVTASLGLHSIKLIINGQEMKDMLAVYIIFNPLNESDATYTRDISLINEYLLGGRIKIYCGSSSYHFGKSYHLDQFSIECIMVCAYFLERMSYEARKDPVIVSRELSALVNGNDDNGLIYGKWDDITDGIMPTAWTSAKQIYTKYLNMAAPVKWGQCFVFSMLLTSMCRNVGILCRSVSGFDIGHDTNKDGVITIFVESESMERLSGSETLWNFHAWNNIILRRDDLTYKFRANEPIVSIWQHLDGTPQERSQGVYKCGPYAVELLRRNIFEKSISYDGEPIYYSINYITKMVRVKKYGMKIPQTSSGTCNLIISTNELGEKVDITHEYKSKKRPEPPVPISDDIDIKLETPSAVHVHQEIPFKISVRYNEKSKNRLNVNLSLKDSTGRNLLSDKIFSKTFMFSEDKFEFNGKVPLLEISKNIDLSIALLSWEVCCYNSFAKLLKSLTFNATILPCFEAMIIAPYHTIPKGTENIILRIKNELNMDVKDCTIQMGFKESPDKLTKSIEVFPKKSTKQFTFDLKFKKRGYTVIQAFVFSPIYNGKIAKKLILVA